MFSFFADKKIPESENVLHYNNLIECLDLHLTEIDLIDYRGSTSEIKIGQVLCSGGKCAQGNEVWRSLAQQ